MADDLLKLFKQRVHDRNEFRSRRRKQLEKLPETIGNLLGNFFKKDPETLKKIEETRAIMAWAEFVGEAGAKISRAIRVRGRTLIVLVEDGLWLQELMYLKTAILRKYQKAFPGLHLSDIFFKRVS